MLLHFGVVFQDPSHSAAQQPCFELRIQDASGNLLNVGCNRYFVVCDAGIPGFIDCSTQLRWRDWTTVGVSLFDLIGQTIYIVLSSADCGQGGHYGYGYAVGECRPMEIQVQYCEGATVARLEAPEGFVSYIWRGPNGGVVGNNQKLSIQNPPDGATYTVTMQSAIGCTSTLSCVIEKTMIAPDFTCDSLTNICYPTTVHLAQFAYASGSDVAYWDWNISKYSENQGTEYVSGDSALSYTFQDTGHYKILLTVYTENGCADTASVIVYSYPAPVVIIDAPDLICRYTETEIFASGADVYEWQNVKRQNTDTSAIIDRGGFYILKGTDARGCIDYDTVEVNDLEFQIQYTTKDNPCFGYDSGSIKINKIIGDYVVPVFHYWKDLGDTNSAPTDNRNQLAAGTYIVYSIDDQNCHRYDTIKIKEPEDVKIVLDTLVGERCRIPGFIEIHAEGGTPPYAYSWNSDLFPSDKYPNPPVTDSNIYELTPGDYTLTVVDKNNCPQKVKTYTIPIVENPIISVTNLIHETCSDENGSIRVFTQNPLPPLQYTWYYNNSVIDTATATEEKTNLKAGDYKIVVLAGNNPNCMDTVETKIYDHPIPEIFLDTISPEYCHRSDGFIKISVKAHIDSTVNNVDYNDSLTYTWTPSVGNGTYIDSLPTGTYKLVVNDKVCENSANYTVEFVEGPVADFVANSYNVATNLMFTLSDNTKGKPIIWLWNLGNENHESGNVIRTSYSEVGDFFVTLYVEDANRCFDSITKKIHVYEELKVFIPNAFTPNGDNINDEFKPKMLEYLEEGYLLEIFDRWGQKVFYTNDPDKGWDGLINKKPVTTTTVYSYRLIARDFTGQEHEYVGHVTLLK
jgi:gliding motility-associated-like protein